MFVEIKIKSVRKSWMDVTINDGFPKCLKKDRMVTGNNDNDRAFPKCKKRREWSPVWS